MDKRSTKIICTLGPSSLHPEILKNLAAKGADYFRINLSHIGTQEIEQLLSDIHLVTKVPIIIDTEGRQVRTGFIGSDPILLEIGELWNVFDTVVPIQRGQMCVHPQGFLKKLEVGDLISIDFNNLLLLVMDVSPLPDHYVICKVVVGGLMGSNRAVHIELKHFSLPPFSQKDFIAIDLARAFGVSIFTLSFIESSQDVDLFKKRYPQAIAIAKIETKKGVENADEILDASDGLMIDRSDLSREIPSEKIWLAQMYIATKCFKKNKPIFIASHILDSLSKKLMPSREEVDNIISSIIYGVTGFALTRETAIGKYPIESLTFLTKLCDVVENAKKSENPFSHLLFDNPIGIFLPEPHGGVLVDRMLKSLPEKNYLDKLPQIRVEYEILLDAEQIAIGTFSPLKGFMTHKETDQVLDEMRLASGVVWTLPIILQVSCEEADKIKEGETVLLCDKKGEPYVLMEIEDIFKLDVKNYCIKLYGTSSPDHPGVKSLLSRGDYCLGGNIQLIKRIPSRYKQYELTPFQTRQIFEKRGWSKVIGFHSRNVPHRSHEYIQNEALRLTQAHGLFIHPVGCKKKIGDFSIEAIINAYRYMEENIYPKKQIIFALFASYSRFAGPREAIFTAICRKNFGCSHIIVGRDHTGAGPFYHPQDSHHIFDKFPDIAIMPVKFEEIVYCQKCQASIEKKLCPHREDDHRSISGTEARKALQSGKELPDWFMRKELSEILIKMQMEGKKILEDGQE